MQGTSLEIIKINHVTNVESTHETKDIVNITKN